MPRIPPVKKPVNISGRRFGALEAIDYRVTDNKWRCLCDCGNEVYRRFCDLNSNIRRGSRNSCSKCGVRKPTRGSTGCKFPGRGIDLVGQEFGRLTVVSLIERTPSGSLWLCACSCGSEGHVKRTTSNLKNTSEPGCKDCETERRAAAKVTHGGAHKGVTRLYSIWKGILKRCRDMSNPHYGGKGIKVCREWEDFPTFRAWARAARYDNTLTIDRLDPSKGYMPSNCEWVTQEENSRRVYHPRILDMNGIRA